MGLGRTRERETKEMEGIKEEDGTSRGEVARPFSLSPWLSFPCLFAVAFSFSLLVACSLALGE